MCTAPSNPNPFTADEPNVEKGARRAVPEMEVKRRNATKGYRKRVQKTEPNSEWFGREWRILNFGEAPEDRWGGTGFVVSKAVEIKSIKITSSEVRALT